MTKSTFHSITDGNPLLVGLAAYLYVFWLLYVCIMGLYRTHLAGRLTGITKTLAYPVVIAGVVVDWWAEMSFEQSFAQLARN